MQEIKHHKDLTKKPQKAARIMLFLGRGTQN